MKKLFRTLLCGAVLALSLSVSAFAAEGDLVISPAPTAVPEKQGDFYVMVNHDYVTFTDATPKIKNDRSCLPFVAVFEQLGFAEKDMTWDGDTSTVTATKGDLIISLTIGKNQIILIQDGQTKVIDTDVAPYIEPSLSRTYIPFGLVADALGYTVGWDAQQGTVIIDDVDAIMAANKETYTLMDKYLAYSKSFSEKNQQVSGSYTADVGMNTAVEGSAMDMSFTVDGDYNMVTAGASALQFNTDMVMDMSMTVDGQDVTSAMTGVAGAPQFPMDIDFEMRGDMADGVFYFQSAALADLMGQPDLANTWFKMDLAAMFDQMSDMLGMDYTALMELSMASLDTSFEETLTSMLKIMPLTSAELTTSDYLALINAVCADSAFEKSGSSYVNTLEMDGAAMTFTLYTNGSKITGYEIEMTALDPSFGSMELTATMKGSKMQMGMSVEMSLEDAGDMTMVMTMDGTYQSTSAKPVTAPPAGAVVIDLNQMMGELPGLE